MPPLVLAIAVGLATLVMNADLAQSAWRPTFVMSAELPDDNKIVMSFDGDQLGGFGGCNRFYGAYTISGNTITIGPLASTRKACPDTSVTEVTFFAMLRAAKTYEMTGDTLVLFNEDGAPVAQFTKLEG